MEANEKRFLEIKKVQNGYLVICKEESSQEDFVKGMLKLLENTGGIEPWQKDKLKDIEETLKGMPYPGGVPKIKTYIFKTLDEAVSFIYEYFGELRIV